MANRFDHPHYGTVGYGGYGGAAYSQLMHRLNSGYGMASRQAYGAYGDYGWLPDPGPLACIAEGATDPEVLTNSEKWCAASDSKNMANPVQVAQRAALTWRDGRGTASACAVDHPKVRAAGMTLGKFDSNTTALVKQFQQGKGLTPDGIVGADTWKVLLPYLHASYPEKTRTYAKCKSTSSRSSSRSSSSSGAPAPSPSGAAPTPFYKETWFMVTAGVLGLGLIGGIAFWPKK